MQFNIPQGLVPKNTDDEKDKKTEKKKKKKKKKKVGKANAKKDGKK